MRPMLLLKDYLLLWSMIIGAILSPWVWRLTFLLPFLVFIMLMLSYTKVRPADLKLNRSHLILTVCQWLIGFGVYYLCRGYNTLMAQGLILIILTPTATAATVITGMLDGNRGFVTAYMLLSNLIVVLLAPILLSSLSIEAGLTYSQMLITILSKVALLLIGPLLLIWIFRYMLSPVFKVLERYAHLTLYFWCAALVIITGNTLHFFSVSPSLTWQDGLWMAGVSLIVCVVLFLIGRYVGSHYMDESVSCGQALGQKNTILSIWIGLAFMNPVVSIIPSFYVVWQNLVNAFELAHHHSKPLKR